MKSIHKIARYLQPAAFALFLAYYLVLKQSWSLVFWIAFSLVMLGIFYEIWVILKMVPESRTYNKTRFAVSLALKSFILIALALHELEVPLSFFILLFAIILLFGWNLFLIFNKEDKDADVLDA